VGSIAVEDFPEFVLRQRGAASIWIDRQLAATAIIDLLAHVDQLFARSESHIIKDQKKIKVARIRLTLGGQEKQIYVKRYNAFSWRYRLGSLLLSSGAVKSLQGAAILRKAGIATPRPVAAVETRALGLLKHSFFLTESIEQGRTADAYWRENISENGLAVSYANRDARIINRC